MKRYFSLLGNAQALDGGAMFGNVPKALWHHWLKADDKNRVHLACRCLLVQDNGRNILFEAGVGAFFEPKLKTRFGVAPNEHVLLQSLAAHGLDHADIDVVVLSHLHFDHAGGVLAEWEKRAAPALLFPKAQFVVSEMAWQRAKHPHPRDRASFIAELPDLLEQSQRLIRVQEDQHSVLGADYRFHFSQGHTPGLMLTEIALDDGPMVFVSDLIPGMPWVHVPVTMGYDRAAELLIDEKTRYLNDWSHRDVRLFYTHDPAVAYTHVAQVAPNRFMPTPFSKDQLAKLKWRTRRGMLELDLLLLPFAETHLLTLSVEKQHDFVRLLECADQDLQAWFTGQKSCDDPTLNELCVVIRDHAKHHPH